MNRQPSAARKVSCAAIKPVMPPKVKLLYTACGVVGLVSMLLAVVGVNQTVAQIGATIGICGMCLSSFMHGVLCDIKRYVFSMHVFRDIAVCGLWIALLIYWIHNPG